MVAAAVKLKEIDLSTRVASFEGVYGAMVIPTRKGPTDRPSLVTGNTQFLNKFTPDALVGVGFDLAHYSALAFLERSNKLWVQRVINGAYYSGLVLKASTSSYANAGLPSGSNISDPTAFDFDGSPDVPASPEITEIAFASAASFFDVVGAAKKIQLYGAPAVGHYFYFVVTDGVNTQTDPTGVGTGHAVNILAADSLQVVAQKFKAVVDALTGVFTSTINVGTVTVTNSVAGPATDATVTDAGTAALTITQGVAAQSSTDDLILLYGSSQGAWGNDIAVKIETITSKPSLIEPNSIEIRVFKKTNLNVPVETFLVSRVQGQKDGRGRNMFIEDVLESSNYIKGISNPLIDELVLPKVQTTALYMTAGTNGSAVTDSVMIAGANKFKSTSQVPVTILMDGGYAVPSYQQALDTIANLRQDCVAILSTPYEAEVDSDYINALTDYRNTDLNLNSSYSALYTPHLQIQDQFNDRKLWIAPDGHVGGSISLAANQYEIWYPAAGFKRGVLNVLDTRIRLDDGEMDLLTSVNINPIRFMSGKGIVIWGQKTLQSRASALDRLNVRLMLIVIEPAIKELLENFLFELNDDATRSIIETKIESYLQTVKARKGVSDFDVVCDDSNNSAEDELANRLNVDVFIKPMYSIEEIPVRIVITPANISFSDAAGAI